MRAERRELVLGGRQFGYELRRSARRTFALLVDGEGVRVNAPLCAPLGDIEGFVLQHQAWLLKRVEQHAQRVKHTEFEPADGAVLPLLGETCRVRLVERQRGVRWTVDPDGAEVVCVQAGDDTRQRLVRALKARALVWFTGRVEEYCARLGVPPPDVRLSSARTRWGSCSRKSGIRLNWRLIHLRPALADYVVAHEVAHLLEMNHSPRFWSCVELLCPDWRALRGELREAGERLPRIEPGPR